MSAIHNPVNSTSLVVYKPQEALQLKKIDSRTQTILKRSLRAHEADHQYFHKYGDGDIIVLIGNSTSGKTSIIQALKKRDPNWTEDGHDLRSDAVVLESFRKHCPSEVALLEKLMAPSGIRRTIYNQIYVWNRPISSSELAEAESALQRIRQTMDSIPTEEKDSWFVNMELQMVDEAVVHSRRGGNMILDVLNVDAFARHLITKNIDVPMTVALVYCPFSKLSARMEKRNKEAVESGNPDDQRVGVFPLEQFSDLYTQKQPWQKTLEAITRSQAIDAFRANFDKGVLADPRTKALSPSEIEKDKADSLARFLDKLGFTNGIDQVDIAPRNLHLYHRIIDSSKRSPEESATILRKGAVRGR